MSVGTVPALKKRRRVREPVVVELETTVEHAHAHVAEFDDEGNGWTTPAGSPLHRHRIHELELVFVLGHSHELTTRRAPPKAKPEKRR